MKRLWLINFAGNALLLALIYLWLGIPDQNAWQLVETAVLAVAIIVSALWLYGVTLAFFFKPEAPWRAGWRRVPALALWLLVLVAALWLVAWIGGYFPRAANWLASVLTLRLRRPVKPDSVLRWLSLAGWIARWIIVPAILLPAAVQGFHRRAFVLRGAYWLQYVFLFALGIYLPYRLVNWVPEFAGLWAQWLSLAIRFTLAWLMLVTAWILLARASTHAAR